ncbi:MAG: ribosome biogenesis GTPase Der [Myxococcales bacterium FL481]|nr:MAG: ribosome biogenesis GTPase Der [Myxococcales bacterium FL481]
MDDEEQDVDDELEASTASETGPLPLVAIVGRPNVGKSTLFNRLVGKRQAIVEDRPGVTRDRLYGVATWLERSCMVVDTGGLEPDLDTGLPAHIRQQVEAALAEADLVLFTVDVAAELSGVDLEIAAWLRRAGKPVIVVGNKADNPRRELATAALHELGLGPVVAVSAAHGRNAAELCDAVFQAIPVDLAGSAVEIPPGLRIAFLGRPNAGKSTLINALMREPRVIVDDTPGTTRDPIHLAFRWRERDLVLIDTAGLRRRKQVARAMEQLAAIKSIRTMEQTQIVVLVIDAEQGVTDQDQRIARMAFERGKGVVVALHKWDLVVNDKAAASRCLARAEAALGFLERPRLVKSSVLGSGRDVGQGRTHNLDAILDACVRTAAGLAKRIPTSALNEELREAVIAHAPPLFRNQNVRLYFATQAECEPPLIVISANRGRCLEPAYERYLLRRIRRRWDLRGIPIRLVVRRRGQGNSERSGRAG